MMPQSIAYASLAGLPAQYGLYTAFIGSFTYIIFGTIKEVSIGPTSLMAILTYSYTKDLPVEYTILLTFLVGCVELFMGIFKLGFIVDFISPCVTDGFTSSMSIVISVSQLKNLFGITKLNAHGFFNSISGIIARYKDISLSDTCLGLSCLLFLYGLKQLPRIQTASKYWRISLWFLSTSRNALAILITSITAFIYHQYLGGSPFVLSGKVFSGLPDFTPPNFSSTSGNETVNFVEMVGSLGTSIIVLPVAAVVANVAIAKSFTKGIIVDATHEMMTLGLCNILGSFIQAMPSTGAFTRSAVANSSGVRTPLQGLFSGLVIILALSFLTPYFYYIPKSAIAAVLISAVISIFKYEIFPKLWKHNKSDFLVATSTFIIGTVYGVEVGMVTGALINILILLKLWVKPKIITETRLDEQNMEYIYVKPEVGLFYPAIDLLSTTLTKIQHQSGNNLPIAIDFLNVIQIDYSACQMLRELLKIFENNCIDLIFINVNSDVYKALVKETNLGHESGIYQNGVISWTKLNKMEKPKSSTEIPLLKNNNFEGGSISRKSSIYDNC